MNSIVQQINELDLSEKYLGQLYAYALWLASLVEGAQNLGIKIDHPRLAIYRVNGDGDVSLDDPVAFATERFRCGNELSEKLLKCKRVGAAVLGWQYHSWYELTKYICFVVGKLCDGTPPWCQEEEVEE